jgi:phage FluMu protein Com
MGMFDRILLECPNCKETLEFQSKGGECLLIEYNKGNIPWEVSLPINGEIVKCPKCSKNIKLIIENLPSKPEIKLQITKEEASYSGEVILE